MVPGWGVHGVPCSVPNLFSITYLWRSSFLRHLKRVRGLQAFLIEAFGVLFEAFADLTRRVVLVLQGFKFSDLRIVILLHLLGLQPAFRVSYVDCIPLLQIELRRMDSIVVISIHRSL